MAYSVIATQKHLERASKFHGMRINGIEHVTFSVAVQMAELAKATFIKKYRILGIRPLEYDDKLFFERESLLDKIAKGCFEKYVRR